MATPLDFRTLDAGDVRVEDVAARYEALGRVLDSAPDDAARFDAVRRADELAQEVGTWASLVSVHFNQDTRNPAYKAARRRLDEIGPRLEEQRMRWLRKLVESPHRPALERTLGPTVFERWALELETFDPKIADDLVEEAKLGAAYTELVASAQLEFQGETLTLSQLGRFAQHPERAVRHDATRLRWGFFETHGERFDGLYDDLVRVRVRMARALGYPDFTSLGYGRLLRTDYGRDDVARYRRQVREEVVPLAAALRERQRGRLGVAELRAWDEGVLDPRGNPKPQGGPEDLMRAAGALFEDVGAGFPEFFAMMRAGHLLDLESRAGKAGGGFCTTFDSYGVPFVFANFNGTKDDVNVFTHEMGHAFQAWSSRNRFPVDLRSPTAEACEVHSMSLELLTFPYMERFFGAEAERYRRGHLTEALLFLPYGVAVDHFQHAVYENPSLTPRERHDLWREMEATYLPWRDWGDLARPRRGGAWQAQLHIYLHPFYYIDYTLAQVCALQFWSRAEEGRAEAMDAYVALCRRGGELPFQALVRSAGLRSPFDDGCLSAAVERARAALGED